VARGALAPVAEALEEHLGVGDPPGDVGRDDDLARVARLHRLRPGLEIPGPLVVLHDALDIRQDEPEARLVHGFGRRLAEGGLHRGLGEPDAVGDQVGQNDENDDGDDDETLHGRDSWALAPLGRVK
jgi:hypothetical protein